MPLKLARKSHALTAEKSKALDQELLDGLERVGFKLDFGEDNTGWQFKYLTRGGGYYFNVGCSDLIVKGDIALKQFADLDVFDQDTVGFALATLPSPASTSAYARSPTNPRGVSSHASTSSPSIDFTGNRHSAPTVPTGSPMLICVLLVRIWLCD